jgi:protease I
MIDLTGKTVSVFIEKFYDEREFIYPVIRLAEAGARVIVAGTTANTNYPGKTGYVSRSDVSFGDLDPVLLDGIVIPGGYAPDHMRRSPECLDVVKRMHEQKKLIAYICHAGWVPISAKVVKGSRATSVHAIKDDMINAGVIWQDAPVAVDGHFITARHADNVGEFMKEVVKYLGRNHI